MRTLMTGTAGMLGSGLVPELVRAGHDVVATDIAITDPRPWGPDGPTLGRLDVRSAAEVDQAVQEVEPDLVLHLAAETDLEICERDPDHAWLTNAVATKHVALACRRAGIPMVYISTAGVFDGTKDGAYVEYDAPNPINLYGRSKFEGERYVQSFLDRFYIIRAGWMVGGGAKDHKFVAKMLRQIKDGKKVLHAVGDKQGTPTYVPDFAACLVQLLESNSYGLYHMACEGEGSRYDVTARILEVLGLTDEIELVEVASDFFKDEFPAPRPPSEIMRNLVLDLQGLNTMRPWRIALEEYVLTDIAQIGTRRRADVLLDLTDATRTLAPLLKETV
jgi:dTDP-4-dehydrorhamnose reductase